MSDLFEGLFAEEDEDEDFSEEEVGELSDDQQVVNMSAFDLPVPGQSLTAEKGASSFEQPPQFTDIQDAVDYLFDSMTKQSTVDNLLRVIDTGMPLMSLAEPMLLSGASEGLWNVDLAMLLIEPTITIMAGLAHMAGVTPVYTDEKKPNIIDIKPFVSAMGAKLGSKPNKQDAEMKEAEGRKAELLASFKKPKGLLANKGAI